MRVRSEGRRGHVARLQRAVLRPEGLQLRREVVKGAALLLLAHLGLRDPPGRHRERHLHRVQLGTEGRRLAAQLVHLQGVM